MFSSIKPLLSVLAAAALMVLGSPAAAAPAQTPQPSAVSPWIELELDAIASHSTNPPRASRALAHLSSAMYLAALSGTQGRTDAMAGAASTVLLHFYPDEVGRIDSLADELADSGSAAFARGRLAGRLLVARARSDGSDAVWTGRPPSGPGYWVPTPPGYVYPPLEPLAGTWRTWNLRRGLTVPSRAAPRLRQRRIPGRTPRGVQGLANADRGAEGNRPLLGRRRRHGHAARALEPDRARHPGRRRLVPPRRDAAVLGAEHRTSRRLHRLLGREVRLLVSSPGDRHPPAHRSQLAVLHHDPAIPLVRLGPLHNVRGGRDGPGAPSSRAKPPSSPRWPRRPRYRVSTAGSTTQATTKPDSSSAAAWAEAAVRVYHARN